MEEKNVQTAHDVEVLEGDTWVLRKFCELKEHDRWRYAGTTESFVARSKPYMNGQGVLSVHIEHD